jgi:cyclohexyl-isocyanide hydratase
MTNRRDILAGGLTTAALLAPFLALEQAMAAQAAAPANPSAAEQKAMADAHMGEMEKVLGPGLWGQEEVGMILYPGFTALDLVGPHYFFACMFGAKVHLITPNKDLAPVASDLGLAIQPTVTMASAPRDLDVIFIPGGTEGTLKLMADPSAMAFIRDRGSRAKHITSVCTGSMVLGRAGFLKGKRATSHWAVRPVLADFGATPVDERVVRDGNVLTGAGVTAGMDFAIALVAQLRGEAYAKALMLQAEYAPVPPYNAGTMATAPADVGGMMGTMFAPLADKFRATAKA